MRETDWVGEAEPRVLKLERDFAAGKIDAEKAWTVLDRLVGWTRLKSEWAQVVRDRKAPAGRDQDMWEVDEFEAAHPDPKFKRVIGISDTTVHIIAREIGIPVPDFHSACPFTAVYAKKAGEAA